MQRMVIEIPDELAPQFAPYQDRLRELMLLGLSQIKAQEALALYDRKLISFARAAELAGLSQPEMVRQARALGIKPHWTESLVQEELA